MENEITIAETVKKDFRAAQVFSRHGIDFCCGGKRTLTDVCKEKKLNETEIRDELNLLAQQKSGTVIDFTAMQLDELVNYIVNKHHRYVNRTIPVIHQYLEKVVKVHGHGYPELAVVHEKFLAVIDDLNHHMMKEENVLFPFISALAVAKREHGKISPPMFGTVQNPIRMMEHEHDAVGELMHAINDVTSGYRLPEGACNTFRVLYESLHEFEDDLHVHIHLENNILFPAAAEMEKELIN